MKVISQTKKLTEASFARPTLEGKGYVFRFHQSQVFNGEPNKGGSPIQK
jgi:hypothetical protein